jgi:hypothetical protein
MGKVTSTPQQVDGGSATPTRTAPRASNHPPARASSCYKRTKRTAIPRSNHERTLVVFTDHRDARCRIQSPSCGSVTWLAQRLRGSAHVASVLGHRPQATAHRPRTAHMASDAEPLAQKSPASRWVQIRPGPGTPTDEAGSPQPGAGQLPPAH